MKTKLAIAALSMLLIMLLVGCGKNQPPTVEILNPADGEQIPVGEEVQFKVDATDPEGKALTFSWDFGDKYSSSENSPHHAYQESGNYTVTLAVIDPKGGQATASAKVHVKERMESVADFISRLEQISNRAQDIGASILETLELHADHHISRATVVTQLKSSIPQADEVLANSLDIKPPPVFEESYMLWIKSTSAWSAALTLYVRGYSNDSELPLIAAGNKTLKLATEWTKEATSLWGSVQAQSERTVTAQSGNSADQFEKMMLRARDIMHDALVTVVQVASSEISYATTVRRFKSYARQTDKVLGDLLDIKPPPHLKETYVLGIKSISTCSAAITLTFRGIEQLDVDSLDASQHLFELSNEWIYKITSR